MSWMGLFCCAKMKKKNLSCVCVVCMYTPTVLHCMCMASGYGLTLIRGEDKCLPGMWKERVTGEDVPCSPALYQCARAAYHPFPVPFPRPLQATTDSKDARGFP